MTTETETETETAPTYNVRAYIEWLRGGYRYASRVDNGKDDYEA